MTQSVNSLKFKVNKRSASVQGVRIDRTAAKNNSLEFEFYMIIENHNNKPRLI